MLGICKPWKPQQTGNLASPRILKRLFPLRTAHRSHRLIPSPTGRGIPHAFMDLNPFRLCSGLKFLGYFMILLLLALIAISYDAVIVLTCVPHLVDGGFNTVLYLFVVTLFHVLLVLLTWSYFMVAFRDPGSVPANWGVLPAQDSKDENYNIPSNSFTDNVSPLSSEGIERITVRYCNLCQNAKPPRCHHCSACQRCVLKMDHHCIWVVNCVGACNYKFFLLFVLCMSHCCSVIQHQLRFMRRNRLLVGCMTWDGKRILSRFSALERPCGFFQCSQRKTTRVYRLCMV
ncbi:probable protein S-acyltransferase 12 isoform X5 [Andrographis paniculata]|uniref:probable protein S-acyltransferase 12 isoform X5 n=1 Tax=Andrographis paniculata TaxID=175694 RepID=UPI0021E6F903|nr:probable protein S-acyltransferase 12 isoform X5 [Andrographis paniculata]